MVCWHTIKQSKNSDMFRARYAFIFLACLLGMQLNGINNDPCEGHGLDIAISLGFALMLLAYFLTVTVASVSERCWKRALSMLMAPVAAFCFLQAETYTGLTPDYAKLLLMRPTYLDQVRQAKGNTFFAWHWEQTWGVGSAQTRTLLIYDETDQIVLPPEARSAEWVGRALKLDTPEGTDILSIVDPAHHSVRHTNPTIKRLANHFYIITEAN